MGHTNSTANLSLPQFIGTDKPTWLGDVNGAMSAIDAYAGTNDAAVAAVDAKADGAVSDAAGAVATATAANNTAGAASTTATNAYNLANNALTVANNADGHTNQLETKVGLLADLHTTDKTSIVNAINEVKDAEGDLADLTTTDKSSLVAAINEAAQGGGGGNYTEITDTVSNVSFTDSAWGSLAVSSNASIDISSLGLLSAPVIKSIAYTPNSGTQGCMALIASVTATTITYSLVRGTAASPASGVVTVLI